MELYYSIYYLLYLNLEEKGIHVHIYNCMVGGGQLTLPPEYASKMIDCFGGLLIIENVFYCNRCGYTAYFI